MHHGLSTIAENQFLDRDKFTAFALEPDNARRYTVCGIERGVPTVPTFAVNNLVEAFYAAGGERQTAEQWRAQHHPDWQ